MEMENVMTSNKERIMGKKKPYGKIALTVLLILTMAFAGTAWAEQQFYPGFIDVEGELGTDGKSWRIAYINALVGEGTPDDFETFIYFVNATAKNTIFVPDSSGTIALTGDISSTMTLSNGTMLVGAGTGLAVETTGTDAQMFISNATEGWGPKTLSGDITITNAGVASVGNNKIGTAELNVSTVNVPIANAATSGTATVTAGSTILGTYAFANVDEEIANITAISSTTLTVTLAAAATADSAGSVIFRVTILAP